MGLTEATCVPCRGGVPTLTKDEIVTLRREVPEWELVEVNGVKRLRRAFTFKDFKSALAFAVKVGDVAEREQHHPDLHVSWGRVIVEVWTHKIRGLHRNDFILAAKADALALS